MSGSGREILPDVPEWWEALLDVRQLSGVPPDVREALPVLWESSGDHPGCPGVVGRPSRMSGSGWEALPDVREWSGGPPGCPGVVGRPSRMFGSGREALPDVQEWSGYPTVCPGASSG